MNPTLKALDIFPGRSKVNIFAFGCNNRELSLKGTTATKDLRKSHPDVQKVLFDTPHISDYYAPAPDGMTGLVCGKEDLRRNIKVTDNITLHRGFDADGVYDLKSGEAFVMSSADCGAIAAHGRDRWGIDRVVIAHAGRNSLCNVNNPDRASVVDNIVTYFLSKGIMTSELKVWIGLSISAGPHFPHDINDPRWPNNRKIVDYALSLGPGCVMNNGTKQNPDYSKGWIDIKQIAKAQFIRLGTIAANITVDSVCTSTETNLDGGYTWHSQSRGDSGRNLVIVHVD